MVKKLKFSKSKKLSKSKKISKKSKSNKNKYSQKIRKYIKKSKLRGGGGDELKDLGAGAGSSLGAGGSEKSFLQNIPPPPSRRPPGIHVGKLNTLTSQLEQIQQKSRQSLGFSLGPGSRSSLDPGFNGVGLGADASVDVQPKKQRRQRSENSKHLEKLTQQLEKMSLQPKPTSV